MALKEYQLEVRDLSEGDTYKDIVRVHHEQRSRVKNGAITRVRVNRGKPFVLAMRGCLNEKKGTIGLDHLTREYMGVKVGDKHQFTFEHGCLWDKLKWAANSAEPGARIATWIAIVSGVIGVIGLYPVAKEVYGDLFGKRPAAQLAAPVGEIGSKLPTSEAAPLTPPH
jgi:hypothetical protein